MILDNLKTLTVQEAFLIHIRRDLEVQNPILKGQDPICRDEGSLDPVADIEEIPTFNCLKIHISILT